MIVVGVVQNRKDSNDSITQELQTHSARHDAPFLICIQIRKLAKDMSSILLVLHFRLYAPRNAGSTWISSASFHATAEFQSDSCGPAPYVAEVVVKAAQGIPLASGPYCASS